MRAFSALLLTFCSLAQDPAPTPAPLEPQTPAASGITLPSLIAAVSGEQQALVLVPDTNEVAERFELEGRALGLCLSTDGNLLAIGFASGPQAGGLAIHDLPNCEYLAAPGLGVHGQPRGMAFQPTGKERDSLWVAGSASGALLQFDPRSGALLRTLKTRQASADQFAIARDGERGYLLHTLAGRVSIVDTLNAALMLELVVGAAPCAVAVEPQGLEVWIANRDSDTLSIVDPGRLEIAATIPCAPRPAQLCFSADGRLLLVGVEGALVLFDRATRTELARVPVELKPLLGGGPRELRGAADARPQPTGLLLEPGGQEAYLALGNADCILVFDLARRTWSRELATGAEPGCLGWTGAWVKRMESKRTYR